MTERQKLWAKSRYLRSEMRKIGPMITGSVALRHVKCGKPNCRCTRGYLHFMCQVTYKEKGKTKTVYVNKERQGEALWWSRNYKLFKKLLKEHTEINLACLIFAFVLLLRTYRRWYGRLTLGGIARCLPTEGGGKSRYKRVARFLDNENFQMISLTTDLAHLTYPEEDLLSVIIDQTQIGDVQVISANVPTEGRSIPLAISTFEYTRIERSQNLIEEEFLTTLSSRLLKGIKVVQIADRGYGKSILLKNRLQRKELFIIREKRCGY